MDHIVLIHIHPSTDIGICPPFSYCESCCYLSRICVKQTFFMFLTACLSPRVWRLADGQFALRTLQLGSMSHLLGPHCLQNKQVVVDLHGPLCIVPKIL